jgi:hypothetical protein
MKRNIHKVIISNNRIEKGKPDPQSCGQVHQSLFLPLVKTLKFFTCQKRPN